MDESSIQILQEDLTVELQALASTQTSTFRHLLQEFNDVKMLLRLDSEAYEREHLLTEKEDEATA
mgnify:CR=1 FL=1